MRNRRTEIAFEDIEVWGPWIEEIIIRAGGDSILDDLRAHPPSDIDAARDVLHERLKHVALATEVLRVIGQGDIRVFHGTRLTDEEIKLVRTQGLVPLDLSMRADRIKAILERHDRWTQVAERYAGALRKFARDDSSRQDGCVHACFSRSALTKRCIHYLTNGAEVDGHIAHHVFGDSSADALFREARTPVIASFTVSFDEAVRGYWSGPDVTAAYPDVADKFLGAWISTISHPNSTAFALSECWATKIRRSIPPGELRIELLP